MSLASQLHAMRSLRQMVEPTGQAGRDDVAAATEQLAKPLSGMRFPGPLERQFMQDSAPRRLRYFLLSGALSLIVFNGFLPVDYLMAPDVFWLAVKIRLGVFTPAALAILLFYWHRGEWVMRKWSPMVLESIVLGSGVMAAACLSYILSASHAPTSQYYHVGLAVVVMYGNMVQRLRFWYAVVFSLTVLAMHIGGVMMMPAFNPRLTVPMVALLIATVVFTLLVNYALERDERRQYLLSVRRKQLLQDLGDMQERLQQLSRMDVLTGLFNRRHFQEYLQQTWQRAQHDGAAVAIIMMDVDHFKRYNDHYGHPQGDQCLMKVAQAMQGSVRRPADLVARFGGEEFIAVLPDADADTACKAAERIRQSVADLNLPHDASGTSRFVTVSVGVASCRARPDMRAEDLIAAADSALYKAKQAGRDQVVSLAL